MQLHKVRISGETTYEKWIQQEGIPIYETMGGVDDVTKLPRRPWARTGGHGTFIQMWGTKESDHGVYVAEIPGGGALNPERHLYEEAILILQGRGLTEVWQEGGAKVTFEWGEGSLFAPPMNAWHRLVNGSREPVIFLAFTTAPQAMNAMYDSQFVFNCDYQFLDRFGGQADYFAATEERKSMGRWSTVWETNFIPDVRAAFLDDMERKVAGGKLTVYRMAGDFPMGQMAQWPVGRYHKAHYHMGGAVIVGLKGKGYVPLWSRELGNHPYQDGHGDEVVNIDWGPNSIYCPPEGWFHQHMNTGKEPARHVAFYAARPPRREQDDPVVLLSVRDGGTLLEFEDEDPEIRRHFVAALKKESIECTMPPVTYRQ